MKVRAVDSDNDWTFGKSKNNYKLKVKAIAQCVRTRLQSFLNDCYFQREAGIDWFNLLGEKDILALQLAITATILNTYGVTTIIEISYNLDEDRNMNIQYKLNTIYGQVIDNVRIEND